MTVNENIFGQVKTLLVHTRSRTTNARIKILVAIDKHDDRDFTEIDIYKKILSMQEKISITVITRNLKKLCELGLLESNKTNSAGRLYKKSRTLEELLSVKDPNPCFFH